MRGYTSYKGFDCSPCFYCKHREKMTVSAPCYNCMDNSQIAHGLPNAKCDFANFEPITKEHLSVLLFEQQRNDRPAAELLSEKG